MLASLGGPGIAVDGHHTPLSGRVDEGRHLASESVGVELHNGGRQQHGHARIHGVSTLLARTPKTMLRVAPKYADDRTPDLFLDPPTRTLDQM